MPRSILTTSEGAPIFDSSGRLQWIEGNQGLAKRLRDTLAMAKNSCRFDADAGTDLSWLGAKASISVARKALSEAILATGGVRELSSISLTITPSRDLVGTFVVKSIYSPEALTINV